MEIDIDSVFSSAATPFVLLDRDLRMRWMNDTYTQVTGRTRETLLGVKITEAFPAEPGSEAETAFAASFAKVLRTGETDHLPLIHYPLFDSDGNLQDRYWSATHTPVKEPSGEVAYVLQNTIDITEMYNSGRISSHEEPKNPLYYSVFQRAMEVSQENMTLGKTAQFLQSIFDQAPSFMNILTGPEHVIYAANKSYLKMIHHRDVVGKTVREAFPEMASQGYTELLDGVYQTGEPVSQRGAVAYLDAGPGQPPEQIYIDFEIQPLRDDSDAIIGIFVQGYNVTDNKKAEASLVEMSERFKLMAQAIPNHVWTAGPEGNLDWLNDKVYQFTGMAYGSLFGGDWLKVVHPDDIEHVVSVWEDAIGKGATYDVEFRIRRHDGAFRWHLVRARPIRDKDGNIARWIGTNTDIEDRKTAEQEISNLNAMLESRVDARNRELQEVNAVLRQSQKMEAVGNLAGGIAHDFNNLLQTITGSLELSLREAEKGSPMHKRLTQAMRAVDRGAMLSSQLLSFGRRQPLAPRSVNLARLLSDAEGILRSAIGEGVEFEMITPDDLWNTFVDVANVENAILNLAINARDAMQSDGQLTLELANAVLSEQDCERIPELTPGEYIHMTLSDTGRGMDEDTLERVFEPFFTTKTEGKGTGLGMSMVYGFVKQSRGHIEIESEIDAGTRIHIYLPRSLAPETAPNMRSDVQTHTGEETILVVEDDDDVREVASNLLMDLGYTVIQARDPDVAAEIIDSGVSVDLLFTDVVMPGRLTSRELADRAKELNPDIAVLFTSGYAQDSIVHDGRLDKGVHLLSKPYTQDALSQKVKEVLDLHASGQHISPVSTRTDAPAETTQNAEDISLGGVRILVVEDEALIRMSVVDLLENEGCVVSEAANGKTALEVIEAAGEDGFAVLLSDLGLPDITGADLAREAQARIDGLKVLFVTGEIDVDAIDDIPHSDALSKPFTDDMLLSALRKIIAAR